MVTIGMILAGLLGILHIVIAYLEMFAKPEVQANAFDMDLNFVKQSGAQLALKNQGIYNAALGVLFLLGFVMFTAHAQIVFFELLSLFVVVVGLYGGATVTKKIYLIQALPGAVTLLLLFLWFTSNRLTSDN